MRGKKKKIKIEKRKAKRIGKKMTENIIEKIEIREIGHRVMMLS